MTRARTPQRGMVRDRTQDFAHRDARPRLGEPVRLPTVKVFRTAIDIDAPPERVWQVMADVERWHEWTASIRSIEVLTPGPLARGSRARVRQPKLPSAVWTVTELVPGERFTWISRSLGVVASATHAVEKRPGGCHAELVLTFAGFLAPLVSRLGRRLTERYLAFEIQGLKRRSESRP